MVTVEEAGVQCRECHVPHGPCAVGAQLQRDLVAAAPRVQVRLRKQHQGHACRVRRHQREVRGALQSPSRWARDPRASLPGQVLAQEALAAPSRLGKCCHAGHCPTWSG